MKNIFKILFILALLTGLAYLWYLTSTPSEKKVVDVPVPEISFPGADEVDEFCKIAKQVNCDNDCYDGFGETCYFDNTQFSRNQLPSDFLLPDETKQACLGVHSYSVCGDCHTTFSLQQDGQLKEVSCEEFYTDLFNKNESCDGCLDIISAGI